eukprot:jgi/Orpsp1_1/1190242/evm.model.d7180000077675.1
MFIDYCFDHKTFDFKLIHLENIIISMGANGEIVESLVLKSFKHPTFDRHLIKFESIISVICQYYNSNSTDFMRIVIESLFSTNEVSFKKMDIKTILLSLESMDDNFSIMELFFKKLMQNYHFNVQDINIKEILLITDRISSTEFGKFLIDNLFDQKSYDFSGNIDIKDMILISSEIKNISISRYLVERIFNQKVLIYNYTTFEKIMMALCKINDISFIKFIFDQIFKLERFNLQILASYSIQFDKILRLIVRYNNIFLLKWFMENFINTEPLKNCYYKKILLLSSRIDNIEIMKLIIEKIFFISSSLESLNKVKIIEKQINLCMIKDYDKSELSLILNAFIKLNDLKFINYLFHSNEIKNSIDINTKDDNNEYPIIVALHASKYYNGNISIFKYLLENGANCNVKDTNGISLFMHAFKEGCYKIINLFFRNNVIPLISDNNMSSDTLMAAIHQNNVDRVSKLLKEKKDGNFNWQNNCYYTPLIFSYILNKNEELFKFLLDNSIDINALDDYGYNILHYAILKEDINTISHLLKIGCEINFKRNNNLYGHSALDISIEIKNKKIFLMLLETKELDIHMINENGETPLISLLRNDNYSNEEKLDWIEKVVEKGSDINCSDRRGKFVIDYIFEINYF